MAFKGRALLACVKERLYVHGPETWVCFLFAYCPEFFLLSLLINKAICSFSPPQKTFLFSCWRRFNNEAMTFSVTVVPIATDRDAMN